MRKSMWVGLALVLVVSLGVSGCASKTYVQEEVAKATQASDAKIGEVQKQVEATQMDVANLKKSDMAQNEQLSKLSDTAKEALARASEAGKLAKGKFMYEVTLTDEAVKFGFNKSELSAEAKAALDAFAARVKSESDPYQPLLEAYDRAVLDRASAGQTGDDVARTIIEAATADVPHLRYQTSDFARAVVAQVRVDPTGDSIVAQMSAQIR